jgi:hypothetical protein
MWKGGESMLMEGKVYVKSDEILSDSELINLADTQKINGEYISV